MLLDEKNRSWHDKILDSYVVDLKESEKMVTIKQASRAAEPAAYQSPEPKAAPEEAVPAKEPEAAETAEKPAEAEMIKEPVTVEAVEEPEAESGEGPVEIETSTEITHDEPSDEESAADVKDAGEPAADEQETGEPAAETQTSGLSMSMKKEELLQAARELGVEVSARATKAAIIEAVEKAKSSEEN